MKLSCMRLQEKEIHDGLKYCEIFLRRMPHMPDVWTDIQMPAKQGVKAFQLFPFLTFFILFFFECLKRHLS